MKTSLLVILAFLFVSPAFLTAQENQQKRTRERTPEAAPQKKPAVRSSEPQQRPSKTPSVVPEKRRVPAETERPRVREEVAPEPPRKAEPSPRESGQPAQPAVPEERRMPAEPSNVQPPAQRQLIPNESDLRFYLRQRHREIFESAEGAISSASIRSLSSQLASRVYISIPGGESGYFSSNQAQYVLESYFGTHRAVRFSFNTFGESLSTPYATGTGSFLYRGSRYERQVYVSLSQEGTRWVISQVNIY